MKARIWTSALAVAATLLGLSTSVQAQPWMGQEHDGMHMTRKAGAPHLEQMAKKLGLNTEQQNQLKALHEKQQAAMQNQRKQNQKLQEERSAAWAAPTLDAARLESLRQQEVLQFEAMSKLRLEHQLAVAKILTPAQRQQMAAWRKERLSQQHERQHERQEQRQKNHQDKHHD